MAAILRANLHLNRKVHPNLYGIGTAISKRAGAIELAYYWNAIKDRR
jgi:hypothetical protein